MFGNPFRRDVSATQLPNEKCRWCMTRIGLVDHAPVPLCTACWVGAHKEERARFARYLAATEAGAEPEEFKDTGWQRMQIEFEKEFRAYLRKGGVARPTVLDVLADSHEATSTLAEIGRQADAAYARKDVAEGDRLSTLLRERIETISGGRTTAIAAIRDMEMEDAQ